MDALPVYLDHHATTPVDDRVLQEMLPWFSTHFGNAASISHVYGEHAAAAVSRARSQVASLLNAPPRCVVFTSGATEANNLALKGVVRAIRDECHVVVNAAEHKAVLDPVRRLQRKKAASVTKVGVDENGRVSPDEIRNALRPETRLVSCMLVNNEVGSINPVQEIGRICRDAKVLFHCDAVQGIGCFDIDFEAWPVDLLSLTAHKIYGPKGIGALIVRDDERRIPIEPQLDGGGHEFRLRSGTLPVPLIVGFGAACEIMAQEREEESARVGSLRDQLWAGLRENISGIHLNGPPLAERAPNNLNVSFDEVDGDALLVSVQKIAVSSGSACTSADPEPSHVLTAMGVPENLTLASLRFGLGRSTTNDDVEFAIRYVSNVVKQLRAERH